tara:strand:+ start:623 stop:994 length:372 start_codon:yes stop_codon:yes gene_type:complete
MKYIALLLIPSLFVSCYQIERNCNDFKTGTYKSKITIDGIIYKSTFSRDSLLQVESFEGTVDSTYVRWINNCEVVFKTINPKNRAEKKDIHLKILTTSEDSYRFEYGYVGDTYKRQGEATRIN